MSKKKSKILRLKIYLNKIYIPGHRTFHPGFEGITSLKLISICKREFF